MPDLFDDDGTRIAPEDLSKLFDKGNPVADDNIDLFLRQRAIGNTTKAKRLGRRYVEDLMDCVWTRPPAPVSPDEFEQQLKLLFTYAVHRIIEDFSPNHIVANTALSSFYEGLEEADPDLFGELNDSAAFSLYLYLHRSGEECAESIGKTFAKLCGESEGSDCAIIGEAAYGRFVGACAQRMVGAEYAQ